MTVTQIMPVVTVPAPPRTPVPFGLFSTVTFRPAGARWQAGARFDTAGCPATLRGIGHGDYCADPATVTGLANRLADGNTPGGDGSGTPFTVQAEHQCSPVAGEHRRLAEERLLAGEERAVEHAFATGILGNTPNLTQNPEALTMAPVPFDLAVGLLEEWISDVYGSQGVIHAPRLAVSANPLSVKVSGQTVRTTLGTPIAAGAGYPGTGPDGAAGVWLYVTPTLTGYRSEPDFMETFDRAVNDMVVYASRDYLLLHDDCGIAAAQVALPDGMAPRTRPPVLTI